MPNGKNYFLHETYRHLELALIGAKGKVRNHINAALENLEKYEIKPKNAKNSNNKS